MPRLIAIFIYVICALPSFALTTPTFAQRHVDARNDALDLHAGTLVATHALNRWRLDIDTKRALKAVVPKVEARMLRSGSPGALLSARYARDKNAELLADHGPANVSQRLLGDTVAVIGEGQDPVSVMSASFEDQLTPGSPGRGEDVVYADERNFWVSRDANGKFQIVELKAGDLRRQARAIFLDSARFAQVQHDSYRKALTNVLEAAAADNSSKALRIAAAKLLAERKEGLRRLAEIDAELNHELEKAKKANRASDMFAITQAMAGAGAAIAQNIPSTSDAPKDAKPDGKSSQTADTSTRSNILINERITTLEILTSNDAKTLDFSKQNDRPVPIYHK